MRSAPRPMCSSTASAVVAANGSSSVQRRTERTSGERNRSHVAPIPPVRRQALGYDRVGHIPHLNRSTGKPRPSRRAATDSSATFPAVMSRNGVGAACFTASRNVMGGLAAVNKSVNANLSQSTRPWIQPRSPYSSSSQSRSPETRLVAPSATTASMRSSVAAAPIASSPPMDSPITPIAAVTSGCAATNETAPLTSWSPYHPSSMARPPLSPWPRAS